MGSIPNCMCYTNKKYAIIESELFVENIENDSYIYNKELSKMNKSNTREKIDLDINKTLSPQNNLYNPLPEIVVIKYKKHL